MDMIMDLTMDMTIDDRKALYSVWTFAYSCANIRPSCI